MIVENLVLLFLPFAARLHTLHLFDDWYLAVAAYNGGPGTMRNAVRRAKSTDFWEIAQKKSLRLETKRYVPTVYELQLELPMKTKKLFQF